MATWFAPASWEDTVSGCDVACPVLPAPLPEKVLPDETLLGGVASGSDELTLAFVQRFQARVYGLALALSGDGRIAEDIAGETFRLATRRAASHDACRNSVPEWLAALTRETARNALRTRRLTPGERAAPLAVIDPGDPGRCHHDRSICRDRPGRFPAVMDQLEAEASRALILAGVGGMTAAEVASVEGIPLATAKARIRTAMSRLRVLLTEDGP
jgi:RNA polymerase sigma-70 factor (ECF subfamily)